MLISSRFCQRHLMQHYGDSTPRSAGVILATLSSLIKPFVSRLHSVWYFMPSLPLSVYSSSPATSGCPWSHPPPLCPLTTWHLFRFIPISWQTAHISPGGHNAAILTNQWQINQCYLFFPCLCCHRFFFLLLCCLWRLKLCSIKLSPLSETNCNSVRLSAWRQPLMLDPHGAYKGFIYVMPHSNRNCHVFVFF